MYKVVVFLLSLLAIGCVKKLPVPEGQPAHIVDPGAAWARVLSEYVDDEGRIDFAGVNKDPEDLETWVAYVAEVSPKSHPDKFPTEDDQLAFWLDAYNGLAMYAAIRSGLVPDQTIRFFFLQKVTVGGEDMTLYYLENKIVRPFGESRIHFALNCMSVGCPRLPQEPWDAEKLEDQLQAAAVEFFNDEKHCRLDETKLTVHLSEILKFYTEDFLVEHDSLIDYANEYRAEGKKIPKGYRHEFIPYDWARNDQPAKGSETTAKTE